MGENKTEEKYFRQIKPEYCCIDLLRATESNVLSEVVSGIMFRHGDHIFARYCPFCGAKIISDREDGEDGQFWSWRTEKALQ